MKKATALQYRPSPGYWKPRRHGEIYCSPSCGGSKGYCKWVDYQAAKAGATKMLKAAGGGKLWIAVVWENLGWYYALRAKKKLGIRVEIHPHPRRTRSKEWIEYSVLVGADEVGNAKTLRGAIRLIDRTRQRLIDQAEALHALLETPKRRG